MILITLHIMLYELITPTYNVIFFVQKSGEVKSTNKYSTGK